ncbi:hypothetical protein LCGC14_0638190 [marine sediment metagenome]|uniref:BioF2-like acetyltransferase domain-containing protein n=1 Tax=marine sediment metagenome TaxID=412755 RepID=A0A0F9U8D0_9ZZZZ
MTVSTLVSMQTALYSDLDKEYNQAMSGPYEDMGSVGLKDGRITGYWRPAVGLTVEQLMNLWQTSQDIYYMDFLENGLSPVSKVLLLKGYTATPYYTQIIELLKPVEVLKQELRKSYKSLVNKNVIINDMDEITPFRRLHEKVKGVTRSQETWDIQQKMLWKKQAFCLTQTHFKTRRNPLPSNTVTDAGMLVYYNEYMAYYASGCSTVDSHALMWQAIVKAKELGCKRFEMGEQVFDDTKKGNISKFKRGFGGDTEVRLILERKKV